MNLLEADRLSESAELLTRFQVIWRTDIRLPDGSQDNEGYELFYNVEPEGYPYINGEPSWYSALSRAMLFATEDEAWDQLPDFLKRIRKGEA